MDETAFGGLETMPEQTGDMRNPERDYEGKTFEENDSPAPIPPKDIIAYNEQRSCFDIVQMYSRGRLRIDPEFQRRFVWKKPMQTQFIDSLLKRLPIPSMCIAYDREAEERIVVDGRQRMETIVQFLQNGEDSWKLAKLDDVDEHLSNKTLAEIRKNKPEYFDRIGEHSLPITVLDCNMGKEDHMEYIFTIFHRLNRGGDKLNNQEIRNCIFSGTLNRMLHSLDKAEQWRVLNYREVDENDDDKDRFKGQELILRFFAFLYRGKEAYKGGMARFLNDFMGEHRNEAEIPLQEKEATFRRVVETLGKAFDNKKPNERIPANVMYPVMVGIAKNIDALERMSSAEILTRYQRVRKEELFSEQSGLASRKMVHERLQIAENVFGEPA